MLLLVIEEDTGEIFLRLNINWIKKFHKLLKLIFFNYHYIIS